MPALGRAFGLEQERVALVDQGGKPVVCGVERPYVPAHSTRPRVPVHRGLQAGEAVDLQNGVGVHRDHVGAVAKVEDAVLGAAFAEVAPVTDDPPTS
jgi:hypothetical protein